MKPSYFEPENADIGMTLREARQEDLPELTDIYNYFIENTAITFDLQPFSLKARGEWFDHYNKNGRHLLLVAELEGKLVGYTSSSPFRPKDAYLTSVETSIYLAPGIQGKKIGTALYQYLFDALLGADVHKAYAGITIPNELSIALHRSFGFEKVGLFQEVGRKFGRYHDVEWWEKTLKTGE